MSSLVFRKYASEVPANTQTTLDGNTLPANIISVEYSKSAVTSTPLGKYYKADPQESTLFNTNIRNGNSRLTPLDATMGKEHGYRFDNPFLFSSAELIDANEYRFIFYHSIQDLIGKGVNDGTEYGTVRTDKQQEALVGKQVDGYVTHRVAVPSLFNPYLAMNVISSVKGIPIYNKIASNAELTVTEGTKTSTTETTTTDGKVTSQNTSTSKSSTEHTLVIGDIKEPDITDCSIKTLVALSNQTVDGGDDDNDDGVYSRTLGMERYKWADFMYCKDLGKISNNYMITLRKFAYPIGDNIRWNKKWRSIGPDVGRMICWLGEDNKLDDIMKYNYSMSWKELNSKIQEKQSQEDSESGGIIGSVVNLSNPSYLSAVAKGYAGGGNRILKAVTNTPLGAVMDNKGTYENSETLGNYDNNRVYTPKDTVQDTHTYEGKLKFSQEFSLVFNYELRAYDNINPRAAFNDLLSNIHYVTYRRGRFWGGKHQINGAPGNPGGWKKANAIIDQAWEKAGGFIDALIAGNVDWSAVWGSISNVMGEAGQMVADTINAAGGDSSKGLTEQNVRAGAKAAVEKFRSSGMSDAFKGMLKNKLGRPALYAFDSLLTGEPVGLWHVTIGNPRAPMLSMGNLIMTGSTVQHYGPLGIDDFPTGLKVTVQLKHGRSRDLMEIQHMYTSGSDALSVPFVGIHKIENYLEHNAKNEKKFHQMFAGMEPTEIVTNVADSGGGL